MKTLTQIEIDALKLYTPPFKYKHGYIWDSQMHMVCDERGQDSIQRIRGWGRISYLTQPEKLQDMLGDLVAQALNEFWEKNKDAA
jgi:hypothetical protein